MPTLKLSCPACGRHLQVPDESLFGKKVKCRQCRKTFIAKAGNLLPPDTSSHDDETFVASLGGSTYSAGSGGGEVPLTDSQRKEGATLIGERRRIGQYLLLDALGQGSMGTVFRALHCRLQKTVAVKLLVEELTQDARALARFDREMVAVGHLSHPNIVQALDAGEAAGVHYLVTEYLAGTDLRKRVGSKGNLPVPEACELIRQAALGLQHAHERGLVHRDIKPSNLFVTTENTIKLLDLGLARRPDDIVPKGGEVTTDGQCVGTPDYMAPEQWTDPRNVDPRADVYGLGCTLFFALVGHAPYAVEADSVAGKMMAHLKSDVPDIQALRPEVPAGLVNLVRRMLAKSAGDRPATAGEVAKALEPFCKAEQLVPFTVVEQPIEMELVARPREIDVVAKPREIDVVAKPREMEVLAKPLKIELVEPPPKAAPAAERPKREGAFSLPVKPTSGKKPPPPIPALAFSEPVSLEADPLPSETRRSGKPDYILWGIVGLAITALILVGVIAALFFAR